MSLADALLLPLRMIGGIAMDTQDLVVIIGIYIGHDCHCCKWQVPLRCGRVLQQPPVGGVPDDSKNESTFVMFVGMPTQLLPHISSFFS